MLDQKLVRRDISHVAEKLSHRGYILDIEKFQFLDGERRRLRWETESLQSERNRTSKQISVAKSKGDDLQSIIESISDLGERLKDSQEKLAVVQHQFTDMMDEIPNLAHESVPIGKDEKDNIEMRRWGSPREFGFKVKDHVDIGEGLGYMDYEIAARLTGSRFVVIQGSLARLHRALAQFMLNLHVREHGYIELNVPLLVSRKALYGTGQLPKFEYDQFSTADNPPYYLIPTGEVPLTNLASDQILEADRLPIRYVAHTPCFRREAGSYGRDTRGMIRQHQFEKVEMVNIVRPEQSYDALEQMVRHAEKILQELELPYRVLTLCTGDMGFSAAKTYDLEVWIPSQHAYREISSCSNVEAFQARRMKGRWRNPETGKPELLHTLNGSGVAVGRALVAVMENYQNEDGSIHVPTALRPYMNGCEKIE